MDISDPNDQTIISHAESSFKFWPEQLVVVGDYAYVSEISGGQRTITAYDVADPADMYEIGTYESPEITACQYNTDMYAASHTLVFNSRCDAKLYIMDVSDPANLSIASSFDYSSYIDPADVSSPRWEYFSYTDGTKFILPFDFYDSTSSPYLYIEVELANINNPELLAAIPSSVIALTPAPLRYRGQTAVAVQGNYAYVAQQSDLGNTDLFAIDVSNPNAPAAVYTNKSLDECWFTNLKVSSQNGIYLGCSRSTGVGINNVLLDTTNPSSPVIGENFSTLQSNHFITIENEKLYSFEGYNQTELFVLDVSNPAVSPSVVGGDARNISNWNENHTIMKDENTAIILSMYNPMAQTIDVRDPNNLKTISNHILSGSNGAIPTEWTPMRKPVLSSSKDLMFLTENGSHSDNSYETRSYGGYLTIVDINNLSNIKIATRVAAPDNQYIIDGTIFGDKWYTLTINKTTDVTSLNSYQINETAKTVTYLDSQTLLSSKIGPNPLYQPLVRDVEIVGDNAIISAVEQQVEVVSVANPSNLGAPTTANLPTLSDYRIGNPYSFGGQLLIPVNGWLYSIDASNPSSMTVSSTLQDPAFKSNRVNRDEFVFNNTEHFQLDDSTDRLVYTSYDGDSHVRLNAEDTTNLSIHDSVNETGLFDPLFDGWDNIEPAPFFIGNRAYGVSSLSDGNFYSFDVTSLNNPKPLDVITTVTPMSNPTTLAFKDQYAYVGSPDTWEVDAEIGVYDITNLNSPEFVGGPVHDFNGPVDMEIKGDYLYAIRGESDLSVFDISNPTFPLTIHKDTTSLGGGWWGTDAHDLDISDNHIYIAHGINGLSIFNIDDPRAPTFVGHFKDSDFTGLLDIEVNGNFIYGITADGNSVVTIDVTNPATPSKVSITSSEQFEGLSKLHINGSDLYATGHGAVSGANITVFDVTNPETISETGSYVGAAGANYEDIRVLNGYAFVAASGTNTIDIFDMSDKTNPIYLKQISDSTLQGVHRLELHNNYLHSLAYDGMSYNVYDILINGQSVGLSGGNGGAMPTPANPVDPTEPSDTPTNTTDASNKATGREADTLANTGISIWLAATVSALMIACGLALLRKQYKS